MKRLLLFFLLLGSMYGFAQPALTNRQMYNYNAGDTIQWSSPYNPDRCYTQNTYDERVVLQKQEYLGYVIYTMKETRRYICSPSCFIDDKVTIRNIRINDLDTAIMFSELRPDCDHHTESDTFYIDPNLGGRAVYGRRYGIISGQPLPNYYSCRQTGFKMMIEGIGEQYDMIYFIVNDPCHYKRKLEFYHKVGEAPYGKRVIVPPGPPSSPEKLKVYPTLIDDQVIHIDYRGEEKLAMSVFATDGRVVKEEVVMDGANAFNLNVNPGLYIIKFFSSNRFNEKFYKVFVK